MFVFITARVSKYFDQGRHISQKEKKSLKKTKLKKNLLHHGMWFFSGLWKILESIIMRPPTLVDVIKGV